MIIRLILLKYFPFLYTCSFLRYNLSKSWERNYLEKMLEKKTICNFFQFSQILIFCSFYLRFYSALSNNINFWPLLLWSPFSIILTLLEIFLFKLQILKKKHCLQFFQGNICQLRPTINLNFYVLYEFPNDYKFSFLMFIGWIETKKKTDTKPFSE